MKETPRIIVIGGTFNPVHIGHLRLAIEISEAMAGARTELVPCAVPPHKDGKGILPFELRHAMLLACVKGLPHIFVNDLEGKRSGPSFTYDTLAAYHDNFVQGSMEIFFCLGLGDFTMLDTWHKGLELPDLAQLIVIPRGNETLEKFLPTVRAFWPKSTAIDTDKPFAKTCMVTQGKKVHALALPRLELSSSFIRARWRAGRSLNFLVPDPARALLQQYESIVAQHWNNE